MKSEEIFKKQLLPKIVLVVFLLIAYEILKLFPFMDKNILGNKVIDWLHLLLSISIIGIFIGAFTGLKELARSVLQEVMKEKIKDWSEVKSKSMDSFLTNCLIVIILLIAYQLSSKDLTVFLGNTLFDTLIRIGILVAGLFFVYKAYIDLKSFLEQK